MAIIQNPLIGRGKGKMGNAIFTKMYDKNVLRSKPIEVYNPRTAKQMKQRGLFKATTSLASQLLCVIRDGYSEVKNMSGYNAFTKDNLGKSVIREDEDIVINWEDLVIAKGTAVSLRSVEKEAAGENGLKIEWPFEEGLCDGSGDDTVNVVVINRETGNVELINDSAIREDKEVTITLPGAIAGYAIYLYVAEVDTKKRSNSIFVA